MRIPDWCKDYTLAVNGKSVTSTIDKGYAVLINKWKKGDVIELNMDMPIEVKAADPRVKQDVGKRAIQRGPLVYCMEETDNKDHYDALTLSPETKFVSEFDSTLLGGVVKVRANDKDKVINFIPYYAWDNREAGKMKVWIDYTE